MIVIDKLTKNFPHKDKAGHKTEKTAVDGLSLRVHPGEVFGLLGPNGAGKTTTIRMLTMQLQPTAGRIAYGGREIYSPGEAQRVKSLIGVVPQHVNFDQDLTVGENMELHARLHHMGRAERQERIRELLQYVELTEVIQDNVRRLSGGMKRRLLIARALIHKPKILFMDEPTVALDPQVRRRIWDLVRNLAREGVTVFLTTHYIEEAENLCQRVAILNKGKLAALDTPAAFKEQLGKFTVEWDGSAGRAYRFFAEKQAAAAFAGTQEAAGGILIRPTNLEDVFIELTGHRGGL
ncbi:MAG: ABC transporter ATP-binding protein [Selenomonas sp.]|uniref:ABC transporter ATP-binding protein n=1 Tax=Selenomonas sp. TaxID=2053611 RepID=UPI0025F8302C|nr:ABC transporter ATP-binding protein [Selenomonas sp.]MCR5757625.1 ABC transporter ATP-binding protein [Selenomonas sp.]